MSCLVSCVEIQTIHLDIPAVTFVSHTLEKVESVAF